MPSRREHIIKFFLSTLLLCGGFCGENLDEFKRWWVSSTTDCARQKTRVNNIFSHLTFFILSYPLESMMESTEATESMTSLYDNIGKTTVVSTLDSCKGSKLREVENSCSSVDLRSTFHRCRKSQGEPGKEIGRRLEGNTNYCCSDNMRDLGYNYTIPKYLKLFLCVVAFRVCMT